MDAREEKLQLAKLAGIEKMVALLEEIAFNTSSHLVDRKEYLERIYAVSQAVQRRGEVGAQNERPALKEAVQKEKTLDPSKHNDGRRTFR